MTPLPGLFVDLGGGAGLDVRATDLAEARLEGVPTLPRKALTAFGGGDRVRLGMGDKTGTGGGGDSGEIGLWACPRLGNSPVADADAKGGTKPNGASVLFGEVGPSPGERKRETMPGDKSRLGVVSGDVGESTAVWVDMR